MVDRVANNIRWLLSKPPVSRALSKTEAALVRGWLEKGKIATNQVDSLFTALEKRNVLTEFFELAHPRFGTEVRQWLHDHGVPWSRIHEHYEYQLSDSIDLYAGFLAGAGVAAADLPIMIGKLVKTIIDGELAKEASKFFHSLQTLMQQELAKLIQDAIGQWIQEYDDLVYNFQWFRAGFLLGNTLMNIALFGELAAKLLIGIPRFIRLVPANLKAISSLVQNTSATVIRTAADAAKYIRDVLPALIHARDLRHSFWLGAIVTPSELRTLVSGSKFRLLTASGFELIYVPGAATEAGTITLRMNLLPVDFVPEARVLIRRNGKLIGQITDPRSLVRALENLGDNELEAFLDALVDTDVPNVPMNSEAMRELVRRAQSDPKLVEAALQFNTRLITAEFLEAIKSARTRLLKATPPGAQPNASVFGTYVETAMKPAVLQWQQKFRHLRFFRKAKMGDVIASHLPASSKILDMTVEQYCRQNGLLARQIGYQGNNLPAVLSAQPGTLVRNLEIDLLVIDASDTQGLLLDWTSALDVSHWNKNLLYHAILQDAFPRMRLPFGEMYSFGLGG